MLTQSPCCRHLCFTDATSCARCGQVFPSGALERKAVAEEKAFMRKGNALFLIVFLILLALLLSLQLQAYATSTGFFSSVAAELSGK